MSRRIHNNKDTVAYRKELRNKLTPAEAFLWNHLKNRQLEGRKFRRQHSIEKFIVDFYCYEEQLIIELDGEVHNEPKQVAYDDRRTKRLEKLGNRVLRFENKMVYDNLGSVIQEIKENFKNSTTSSSPLANPLLLNPGGEF
ncbi:endonuclease domain-containing protein [Maribacter arenosus]|uniref:Endonuclease domain-containing protein n=1 Tax=Maribacter arenosus TaxID=1854708 RepID=A0ABR7VBR1_9FLAO|nr:endonuclease domain-containing protein [Maribacter arenosus]MBD0850761.1 endonuclease domain-containing protein [Maribacter arenosus]